jgi:hypothetical protein
MFKEVAAIDNQHEPISQGAVKVRMAHHQLGLFSVIVHFTTRDIHHSCIHNYKFYIVKSEYYSWSFDGND